MKLQRYLINPSAYNHSLWTPEIYQMIPARRNPRYLQSLWLVFWNIVLLPTRIWHEFIKQVLQFRFKAALIGLFMLPSTFLLLSFFGITGNLICMPITLEELLNANVATPDEGEVLLELGIKEVLIDRQDITRLFHTAMLRED